MGKCGGINTVHQTTKITLNKRKKNEQRRDTSNSQEKIKNKQPSIFVDPTAALTHQSSRQDATRLYAVRGQIRIRLGYLLELRHQRRRQHHLSLGAEIAVLITRVFRCCFCFSGRVGKDWCTGRLRGSRIESNLTNR